MANGTLSEHLQSKKAEQLNECIRMTKGLFLTSVSLGMIFLGVIASTRDVSFVMSDGFAKLPILGVEVSYPLLYSFGPFLLLIFYSEYVMYLRRCLDRFEQVLKSEESQANANLQDMDDVLEALHPWMPFRNLVLEHRERWGGGRSMFLGLFLHMSTWFPIPTVIALLWLRYLRVNDLTVNIANGLVLVVCALIYLFFATPAHVVNGRWGRWEWRWLYLSVPAFIVLAVFREEFSSYEWFFILFYAGLWILVLFFFIRFGPSKIGRIGNRSSFFIANIGFFLVFFFSIFWMVNAQSEGKLPGLDLRNESLVTFRAGRDDSQPKGVGEKVAYGVRLEDRSLQGARFDGAFMPMAVLQESQLQGASFVNAVLREAELRWADLSSADLTEANLTKANLQDADLVDTALLGTVLCQADLWEVDLTLADLYRADLRGADLTEANLMNADFSFTDLRGADLRGTVLESARFIFEVKLGGAKIRRDDWPSATRADYNVAFGEPEWWVDNPDYGDGSDEPRWIREEDLATPTPQPATPTPDAANE